MKLRKLLIFIIDSFNLSITKRRSHWSDNNKINNNVLDKNNLVISTIKHLRIKF